MTQPTFDFTTPGARRPWKRTTGTSRAARVAAERSGLIGGRHAAVGTAVRAAWNARQQSPTSDEVAEALWQAGAFGTAPRDETRRYWYVVETRRRLDDLRRLGEYEHVPQGVRPSRVSGRMCETWRARERGTDMNRAPTPVPGEGTP